MPTKKYMDEHVLVHTLRIELLNGRVLRYNVDAYRKEEIENWLQARSNDLMEFSNEFISFYAVPDRMAFVRIAAIKRLILCWDAAATVSDPWEYQDHFEVTETIEDELLIPEIIILLRNDPVPLIFTDINPDSHFLGYDEQSLSNDHFLKGGFISLTDEDGEQNYIPVINIDCLEVDRRFIYPDEVWDELENMRDIENNTN